MLGNFSCFCCHLLTFFKVNFSKNSFWNTISVSNILIQIWTDYLLVLIWVQTVCIGYQQTTTFTARMQRVKEGATPFSKYLHPISIIRIEKIFSEFVLGDTFPKPTLVKLLKVKYKAVTYFDLIEGPPELSLWYSWCVCRPRSSSQPIFGYFKWGLSKFPIAYHTQASQWAIKAKVAISNNNMDNPYSEYLSNFLATLTSRNNRAVFNSPMRVVVWKKKKTRV